MAAVGGSRLTIGENMIMTYDWMVYAQNHPDFKKEIEEAIESGEERELTSRQIHGIRFEPERQSVVVTPFSDHSDWCVKIIPKRITYRAVLQAINGDWNFSEADISDVD